jgi:hypothetical protein
VIEEKGGRKPTPCASTLDEWVAIIERSRDEALGDLVPTDDPAAALAALERARAAWARVHDQLSLEL